MRMIRELRDGCSDHSLKVPDLLRKAKVLAVTLHNEAMRAWVTSELNGYTPEDVPSYRVIHTLPQGTVRCPNALISNQLLPISQMPDFLRAKATSIAFPNAIGEIEAMSIVEGQRVPWPPEVVSLLNQVIGFTPGCVLVEVYQRITPTHMESILDSVRNRLLDFVLGLQEIDPEVLDSDKALAGLPPEQVNQVFNVSIYGDHNVVASGRRVSQQIPEPVEPMNRESLANYLTSVGLRVQDVHELQAALEADGNPPTGQLGARVKHWIGTTVTKALDGTWKVALGTAPELLKAAIFHYYGWH